MRKIQYYKEIWIFMKKIHTELLETKYYDYY